MSLAPPLPSSSQRAFPSAPRVDRYFGSASAEAARTRLVTCLERGEGPALLLGSAGIGKTMLLEVIAASLGDSMRVVRLASTQLCTRRALLQAILHGLDGPYQGRDEGELRLALSETILDPNATPAPIALLIDEAQTLPTRLLEELRLMANAAVHGEPRLRLLLAGTGTLDETFGSPELEAFSQRIAARCYLSPLSREETIHYIRSHIAAAGGEPDTLFTPDAYDSIFQASEGLPRLINQVGDRALMLAVEKQEDCITGASIQEAWSDLHQLPAPWHTPNVALPVLASPHELLRETDEEESCAGMCANPCGANPCGGSSSEATVEFGLLEEDDLSEIEEQAPPYEPACEIETESIGLEPIDETELDEDQCIAYAFPTRPEVPAEASPPEEPREEELETDFSDPEKEKELLAGDPFAEPFDEEEIVLDRFVGLEAVLQPGGVTVTNRHELDFGNLFEALSPAVESLIEDVEASLESTDPGTGFNLIDSEAIQQEEEKTPEEAGDLLVVEDEQELELVEARVEEYGQLFSDLRRS